MTTVLTVCTGNVCRSPAAERLLTARLAPLAPGITVASAGTGALVDAPVDPPMAALVAAAGADVSGFAARQLTAGLLEAADLVLVMTREHRGAVVRLAPGAVRRTFLLREAAAVAEAVASVGWPEDVGTGIADRLRALPRLAPAHRGVASLHGAALEVPDPYRQAPAVYAEAIATITEAVGRLVTALR
ncbi:hypothetical protein [Modestobacter sp. SSW1-42]|uniref:arsenate reductase/protein-tyrosine-phosphatase family protein n=1 Tax=Modestobacter sp. SSW1-42 TaxID=596372 RepID=UPI003986C8DC